MNKTVAGQNSIFPGFYRDKNDPASVGYVSQVKDGLVSYQGTQGRIKSALMGSMEFMRRFEKTEQPRTTLGR